VRVPCGCSLLLPCIQQAPGTSEGITVGITMRTCAIPARIRPWGRVDFFWRGRGVYPFCNSRHMAQTAAQLVQTASSRRPERRLSRPADASVVGGQRQPFRPGSCHDQAIGRVLVKCCGQAIHFRDHGGADGDHLDRG